MQPDTLSRVAQIVANELNRARAPRACPPIDAETSFERDLRCCAIDMVCISLEVEDAFDIQLPCEELENCDAVGALAALVDSLLVERKAA